MRTKNYYTIKNVKESGCIVVEYVATSYAKAIEFLKRMYLAEYNSARVLGYKCPVDTTDSGFFYYSGNGEMKGGEWKIEQAFAV